MILPSQLTPKVSSEWSRFISFCEIQTLFLSGIKDQWFHPNATLHLKLFQKRHRRFNHLLLFQATQTLLKTMFRGKIYSPNKIVYFNLFAINWRKSKMFPSYCTKRLSLNYSWKLKFETTKKTPFQNFPNPKMSYFLYRTKSLQSNYTNLIGKVIFWMWKLFFSETTFFLKQSCGIN